MLGILLVACTETTATTSLVAELPTPTPVKSALAPPTSNNITVAASSSTPTPFPTRTPIPTDRIIAKTTEKMDSIESFSYLGKIKITGQPSETVPFDRITYFLSGERYNETWSCYKGDRLHCGRCGTCVERKEAFELIGATDPTQYQ